MQSETPKITLDRLKTCLWNEVITGSVEVRSHRCLSHQLYDAIFYSAAYSYIDTRKNNQNESKNLVVFTTICIGFLYQIYYANRKCCSSFFAKSLVKIAVHYIFSYFHSWPHLHYGKLRWRCLQKTLMSFKVNISLLFTQGITTNGIKQNKIGQSL